MPYILEYRRAQVDIYIETLDTLATHRFPVAPDLKPQDCGELNYAMTMLCIRHDRINYGGLDAKLWQVASDYLFAKPLRYQRINDVVGAAHCAEMELTRRRPGAKKFEQITLRWLARKVYSEIAVGYEIQKIAENGDIDYGESRDAAALRQKAWGCDDEAK